MIVVSQDAKRIYTSNVNSDTISLIERGSGPGGPGGGPGPSAHRDKAVRADLLQMGHPREVHRREHQMREALLQVDPTDRLARVDHLVLEVG